MWKSLKRWQQKGKNPSALPASTEEVELLPIDFTQISNQIKSMLSLNRKLQTTCIVFFVSLFFSFLFFPWPFSFYPLLFPSLFFFSSPNQAPHLIGGRSAQREAPKRKSAAT